MLSFTASSALLGLITLVVASIYHNNTSGLKDIPNAHFSVPYSRLWLTWIQWRQIENRTRVDFHRQLGPVVRIGPRHVSVNCIDEGIRTIYSSRFDKEKSYYGAFIDQTVFMFTMLGNDEHKQRKRMLSHVYSKSYILKSEVLDNALSSVSNRLREQMAGWARTSASVDVVQQAKCCAVDVVTGWLFGMENATDSLREPGLQNDLSKLLAATFDGFFMRANFSWLVACLEALKVGVPRRSDAYDRWSAWTSQVNTESYRKHLHKSRSTASMYDHFYDAFKAANPNMSHYESASLIAAECEDHLAASHQGIGIVLTYAMYELSRNPNIQHALREELLVLANPNDRPLSFRIEDLPVLDAVVTETLRTRAPGPGPFPRVVPDTGCRLAGRFDVPGGTVVSSSVWALHYSPAPYHSPEEWRPERWLKADEAALAEMRKWFWAFGNGPRMCIGVHLAVRILKELLVTIYTDYETSLDPEFIGNMEPEDKIMAWPIAGALNLKFHRLA